MEERVLTYAEAIREATEQEMERDPSVVVLGLGVDDHKGIYGTTKGLVERFGAERVFDTPLSEDGMTGVAIGAAMAGLRPIHVHIRMDFMLLAMNQLINIAAKAHYMYGAAVRVPLVVRTVIGRSWGQGAQHSQALHAFFMHVPGLKVVAPSTPYDAKGCLIHAIRDNNPVIFVEHRMIHSQRGHVPLEAYEVPLGRARVLARGSEVTLVGISYMTIECLRARAALRKAGLSAEVIDVVTLSPLDIETIAESVERTGALVIVDTGWLTCGASAEIIAAIAERFQKGARILVRRLGYGPVTCPTTQNLQDIFYPSAQTIAAGAHELVNGQTSWIPEHEEAPEIVSFKGPF